MEYALIIMLAVFMFMAITLVMAIIDIIRAPGEPPLGRDEGRASRFFYGIMEMVSSFLSS